MQRDMMLQQFIRFFVVGIGATLIHLAVYLALNELFRVTENTPLLLTVTYAIGYAVSFIANYIVSLKWTFKTSGSVSKGAGFAFSHLVNAGMHLALLNAFRSLGLGRLMASGMQTFLPWLVSLFPVLGKAESLLPFPVYCIVVPLNFLMVRFFLTRGDHH